MTYADENLQEQENVNESSPHSAALLKRKHEFNKVQQDARNHYDNAIEQENIQLRGEIRNKNFPTKNDQNIIKILKEKKSVV